MNFLNKMYKQFFINGKGEVSITKIALQAAAAGAAILAFPASMTAVGITIVLPPAVTLAAKAAVGIGVWIAGNRVKDSVDAGRTQK
jgi:hypothetical protein